MGEYNSTPFNWTPTGPINLFSDSLISGVFNILLNWFWFVNLFPAKAFGVIVQVVIPGRAPVITNFSIP